MNENRRNIIFKSLCLCLVLLLNTTSFSQKKYPYSSFYLLKNCNRENRIITYTSELDFFKWWVLGQTNLETNKIAHFSPDYILDSNYLRQGINKIKKNLPLNFWTFPIGELWYNNEPNEDSIWFIEIFAQVDKENNIKVLAGYKIFFEGKDARDDNLRANPRIKKVEFIIDKLDIQKIEIKLKNSPFAQ